MPALPVPCREILAEALKDTLQRVPIADPSVHFDGFFTLAALRALMMLFILLGILLLAVWRIAEIAEPDPVPEVSQKPRSHLAVDKLLQVAAPPSTLPSTLPTGRGPTHLPEICPPYMRATQGAELSLRSTLGALPKTGAEVYGLGGMVKRGSPTCLLTAQLREGNGDGRWLELREKEPGTSQEEPGKVLLSATETMELWKGEVNSGEHLGTMQRSTEGRGCLRQRFLLGTGEQAVALSVGAEQLELGLASGRLLASCRRADLCITVKPEIDAVFALGCILMILAFDSAPPVPGSDE
ncbi:unnamed protein product [Durusdinium trenchii]|uniref:Phospholipid scramblase n=2 Tax=Durusdinium trenchii TaxID=1381693 RepID=A0ABP0KQD8_9DINO